MIVPSEAGIKIERYSESERALLVKSPGGTYGMITGDLKDVDTKPLSKEVICSGFLLQRGADVLPFL